MANIPICKLDEGRRLARRKMAWISFYFLLGMSSFLIGGIIIGGPETAAGVAVASSVIKSIFGVFTAILLTYLGVSMIENTFK